MIDFPIDELLDEDECAKWLQRRLHPNGLKCPRCASSERRVAQRNGPWTAYRCKACDRYHTILTGTVFEKTRQPPSKVVLILRGIAKGEPTARLAREIGVGRPRMHEIRKRVQRSLHHRTLASEPMTDEVLEADELYQNAGEKRGASYRPRRSAPAARQQAARTRHL